MIKGILFDKDGTLIEFRNMWHQILVLVYNEMKVQLSLEEGLLQELKKISGYTAEGFEKESPVQYLSTTEIVSIWADFLYGNSAAVRSRFTGKKEALCGLLLEIFENAAQDEDIPVRALDGAVAVLDYLKNKKYFLGVATADTNASAAFSLKKANLYDYFCFIGTDDGALKAKPDPEMAQKFCEMTGIRTDELLIVGDSINDRRFAENAGARFIGIKTDYNGLDDPDGRNGFTVNSIKHIIETMGL